MNRPLVLVTSSLIFVLCFSAYASAELAVGVKSGDWIEYLVYYTGEPAQEHDVAYARMEIHNVQGPSIHVLITSHFADNTSKTLNSTMNLQTGHLFDDFIIPAGLSVGESFQDENLGTITIDSSEARSYVGVERIVLISTVGSSTYIWDQATGISLEGETQTENYMVRTIVAGTNLWQTQRPAPTVTQNFDFVSIVLVAGVGVIVFITLLMFIARYIRSKACQLRDAKG